MRPMTVPVIVPRAEHAISRSQIDADALKVLYRLHQNDYVAYLVGGSVRDLLLGRRPKDFDIGTSAHPYQVKRLFRNCWIIGRRFRLAHVKFGAEDDRGGHVPPPGLGRGACGRGGAARGHPARHGDATARRSPGPSRQHVRHARRGRVPPRLHGQRALLRHRHVLDHRLHRRPRGPAGAGDPVDRRTRSSASRKIRSACCAP